MGIKERRLRRKQEVYTAIVDVAMDILNREGAQGISMRKIADKIEYSPPVIYSYFENKEAILMVLAAKGYNELKVSMQSCCTTATDAVVRIENMLSQYMDFALREKELYLLMFSLAVGSQHTRQEVPEAEGFVTTLKTEIEQARVTQGTSASVDFIYHTLIAVAHGIISVCYVPGTLGEAERKMALKAAVSAALNSGMARSALPL